jgi:hypothetical protein
MIELASLPRKASGSEQPTVDSGVYFDQKKASVTI